MSSSNALTPVSRGNRRVRNLEGKEVGGLWGLHVSWQAPPVQAGQAILKLEGRPAGQLCVGNNFARQMKRGSLLWSQTTRQWELGGCESHSRAGSFSGSCEK